MTTPRQPPAWPLATSLRERQAAAGPITGIDPDRAARRLHDWRARPFDAADERFRARLLAEGIDEDTLRSLLGEPAERLAARLGDPPAWVSELDAAFAEPCPPRSLPTTDALRAHPLAPFLGPLRPLVLRAHDRVLARARALAAAHPGAPFDPETVVGVLWPAGAEQVLRRVGRTFVLELAIARMTGQLDGATPEARFESFVRALEHPERMRALLDEYPVLGRQLVLALDRWVAASGEQLEHLCADAAELRARFSPERSLGTLVGAIGGGDLHRGGRAVRVLRFDSGLRLVHKPRSLGIELHFNALLAWLSRRSDRLAFRTLAILDRGDHGWVEHVEASGCRDLAEVRRFHERLGGLLALLSGLAGTDMHHENLIAAGEHPVLIDLEGLFHPDVWTVDLPASDRPIHHALADSVLAVGLLPWRVWADEQRAGIDVGGLAQMAGQRTPFPGPVWRAAGTDLMHLDREHQTLPADHNRPTLAGEMVDALDHLDALVSGFDAMYRLLVEHRDALLHPTGPLAAFADDESRAILRSTMAYTNLLQESFHPDVLRDAVERDRLWDELWALVEHRPSLAALVAHERADLHQGDIPLFVTRPSSGSLHDSRGEPIAGFPALEPGLDRARRCLARMGDEDHAHQRWLIHASMATESPSPKATLTAHPRLGPDRAEPAALLAAACAIGERLAKLAIPSRDASTWIALAIRAGGRAVVEPQNLDLYDGLPGTALFLAQLGAVTGQARYTALARAAVAAIRRQLEQPGLRPRALGALVGWGGMLYTWAHLGALWSDASFFDEAATFLDHLPPLLEHDVELDISGGAAGCIVGLLALARADRARVLAHAQACGDRLLATAHATPAGLGWVQVGIGEQSLTGLAHGNAGRALALFQLAAATGDERYRQAARAALAHERAQFMAEAANWPDLRTVALAHRSPDQPLPCRTSWCHGAPGIGLARLATLAYHDDAEIRGEIEVATRTTLAHGFGDNHCACHGDLGNVELFLLGGEVLGDAELTAHAYRHAAAILRDIDESGIRCGVPRHVETPGFFTGLAGIGHQLLRLAAPGRVPSILALARPPR